MARRAAAFTQADVARVMRAAAQAWPHGRFRIRIIGDEIVAEPHPAASGTLTEGSSAESPEDTAPSGRAVRNNPPVDGRVAGSGTGGRGRLDADREWRL